MAHTRGFAALLLLAGLVAPFATLEARDAVTFTRVRGVGSEISRLIERANAQSGTFGLLVDGIQRSNAIVILQPGRCRDGLYRSCLVHLEGNAQARSIRILVDTRVADDRLMATIAHELHHATELISDTTVVDAAGVRRFYRGVAMGDCAQGASDVCETEGALQTETRVLDELRRSSRH